MGKVDSYDANAGTLERPLTLTLEEAFDAFNAKLWDGKLPPVMLLVHRSLRTTTGGYYSPGRWRAREDETAKADDAAMRERDIRLWEQNSKLAKNFWGDPNGWELAEIALNPESWPQSSDRFILSVLVHEMAHHWQECFGVRKARKGYHNREWGKEMKRVGLHPSDTGLPDGEETGTRMSHYIVEDGPFSAVCDELLSGGVRIKWEAPKPRKAPRINSKVKYTCPTCEKRAWAKPETSLVCGDCQAAMTTDEDEDDE